MTAAQEDPWRAKERGEEARYAREKEQEQFATIRAQQESTPNKTTTSSSADRDFEGGFGGQEDLEDRYATTCGEH